MFSVILSGETQYLRATLNAEDFLVISTTEEFLNYERNEPSSSSTGTTTVVEIELLCEGSSGLVSSRYIFYNIYVYFVIFTCITLISATTIN